MTPSFTPLIPCPSMVCVLALATFATLAARSVPAQDSTEHKGPDFAEFRIISERNIFNPDRAPKRDERQAREERRPTRIDSLALVGTMSYEKGRFAFFDGSDSEYRKVLKTGDSIAGFTICEITPSSVKLDRDGSTLSLAVNAELRREDEGEWRPTERTTTFSSRSSRSSNGSSGSSGSDRERGGRDRWSRRSGDDTPRSGERTEARADTSANSTAAAAGDADVSEVLKRLMEQREKELK